MNEEISKAIEHLNNGGVILYPCDTIWGMGCDATNQKAIDKIYAIKKRKPTSPLICLMSDFKMAEKYLTISSKVKSFLNTQKRPTTIVFNKVKNMETYKNSIAIRIPNDQFCISLISKFGKPITSTSVNFSGKNYPEFFKDIDNDILKQIDYAVNLRRNEKLINPSKIVKIKNDSIITLRE
ncbi:MAG: threonylcarbamoyl-AMP synthase [Flavobacteriaceae bacterium]|nr:threonylcarbamoyl-AMP synthase [Flavobacteriaceae bacterium]